MPYPLVSRKKAKLLAFLAFLVGLFLVSLTGNWWPGIMLAIGIPLSIKQYLIGKNYDTGITLFVFLGVFVSVSFDIEWKILLPVLFTIGGIYIFYRDVLEGSFLSEEDTEVDLNEEIEEEQHKK